MTTKTMCAVIALGLAAFAQPAAASTINVTNFGTNLLGLPPTVGTSTGQVTVETTDGSESGVLLGGVSGQLLVDAGSVLTAPAAAVVAAVRGAYTLPDFVTGATGSSGSLWQLNLNGIAPGDRVRFTWAFATNEFVPGLPSEGICGTPAATAFCSNNDFFRIGLFAPLTGTTTLLAAGDLTTTAWGLPTGAGTGFSYVGSVFQTSFTFATAGNFVLEFLVGNALDDQFSSALVVSDVFRVPEPGTLALFGLGIAGLALARRRRAA